ncbi:MAG: hypothetical protein HY762_01085 [Planctomycetes bacterium]|nr:hypothetical protein [Planctomycetota bacterium]
MNDKDAFDRVNKLLEELKDLPLESFHARLEDIEGDLKELFKRLEKIHSLSSKYESVDLSENIYALVRLMTRKKETVRRFPLLFRAAGAL